jgi:hypothetical protein
LVISIVHLLQETAERLASAKWRMVTQFSRVAGLLQRLVRPGVSPGSDAMGFPVGILRYR